MQLKLWLTFFILGFLPSFAGGNLFASNLFASNKDSIQGIKDYPFIIITNDSVNQLPAFSDEEFYNMSTGVIFTVSKTDIKPDDPFITLYRKEIVPVINQQNLQLRKIYIRGAASPEGPYTFNQYLGKARTQALLNELQKDLRHQNPDLDLNSVTEDYGYLCLLMKEANDPYYPLVAKIYASCNGDELECKKQLMQARKGRLWGRLLKLYYPRLRAARLILWFTTPSVELPSIIQSLTRQDSLHYSLKAPELKLGEIKVQLPAEDKSPRRHLIAVRTNLLHDFFYMPRFGWAMSPNIQLEYYPLNGHYTYNVGMTWGTHRHWETQEFFQVRDFQFELRRYFRGKGEFMGAYLGAYLHGNKYGIGLDQNTGWEGEGGGAGLSLGYVMPLNKRKNLRLEFMAALGYYMTYYDPYVYGNPLSGKEDGKYYYDYRGTASAFKERNHKTSWFGPTNVGIQVTYDIIYRSRKSSQKGGKL